MCGRVCGNESSMFDDVDGVCPHGNLHVAKLCV
jgi:hypothetical protein